MAFASDKTRQGTAGVSTGGYSIDNSLRFNDNDSAYLSRTPSSAGNRKTWTWSGWVKRSTVTTSNQNCFFGAWTSSADRFKMNFYQDKIEAIHIAGNTSFNFKITQLLRDVSSWYHIVLAVDTTQSTSSDRYKIYINGTQVTAFDNISYPSLNWDGTVNTTIEHTHGESDGSANYLDGYLAEVNFVDGQALTPSDFGETGDYGEWKAKKYTGTYGTNGFYLDFKNSGSLGNDANGSNNWTVNNLAATDQMLDSPTNNFCTWNPVSNSAGGLAALSEGNLRYNPNGTSSASGMFGTIGVNSGKWYFEVYRKTAGNGFHTGIAGYSGSTRKNYLVYAGQYYYGDNNTTMGWASPGANGEIISCAFDLDNNKIWFARNNVWKGSGNPSAGSGETDTLTAGLTSVSAYTKHANASYTGDDIHNFGQDSSFSGFKTAQGNADDNGIGDFYYTPPTGYLALCTQNLPEPTVVPSEHFNTVTYTGTGGTQSITGVGFQPDFVWIKNRSNTADHALTDAVRGATKTLRSSSTIAEFTSTAYLASLGTDGFSLGSSQSVNASSQTYASWNWKANGAGVSNTNGTITSTVSANADAGFSIVSYTGNATAGATIGHGLSSKPEFIFVKKRSATAHWSVYNATAGATKWFLLNLTSSAQTASTIWNNTEPTSSVLSVGTAGETNTSAATYIAYCFHSVEGYSKVGSYTGNGSADGTFVHCGFRPAYVMVKDTTVSHHWWVWDTARRNTYNEMDEALVPNLSVTTQAPLPVDSLSNGFKFRTSNTQMNTSGNTYIYLAFAEHPFKYTNAR